MKITWKTWLVVAVAVIGLLFVLDANYNTAAIGFQAVSDSTVQQLSPSMYSVQPSKVDTSSALRDIQPVQKQYDPLRAMDILEANAPLLPKAQKTDNPTRDLSIVQSNNAPSDMPPTEANFEGISNSFGVQPPDTQGVVGPNHYVQWVNLGFQIWDKSGNSLYGPANGNTLFTGFGGPCEATNDGDPISLYDAAADRWLMSQFAFPNFPNGPFYQCIAISQTGDPLGQWYRYQFTIPVNKLNDYPHFGLMPDAYYMTVNQFNGGSFSWGGAGVAAFDRSALLAGDSNATMVYVDTGAVTLNYGGQLPADNDGLAAPAGSPGLIMEWDDSTWLGDTNDTLRIWEFHPDFGTPANSTFGTNANYDPNYMIATADVDPDMCGFARNCIPQPGTSNALDAISDRLMYRLQYRNFGGYETLVGNHTVDSDGTDHAGIHWFILRDSGSGWDMYDQGVYAPDTDNRWMASAALDQSGNLAVGFSVSSSSTFPSIRYAGKLASDPPGSLAQGEATLMAGTGSQTSFSNRWGDYSMLSLDTDECTFWYTTEYYGTNGSTWQTRIGSFKYTTCGGPTGTLSGQVYDSSTMTGINGAQIIAAGQMITHTGGTNSGVGGLYTVTLPVDTYTVTASAFGYAPATVSSVDVFSGTLTTQNIALDPAPTVLVEGVITDDTAGWPLYARIDIGGGYPGGPIWTDPVTGHYAVELPVGTYPFTINAFVDGYTPKTVDVTVSTILAPQAVTTSYCSTPNLPIPDNNPAGIVNIQNIATTGTITDLNLKLNANHTWLGDLKFTLSHASTTVTPFDRPGVPASSVGCQGDNLPDIVLDDDGEGAPGTPVETSCTNTNPGYTPNGYYTPNNPLSAFDGQGINGAWTLNVSDNAASDTGTLNSWCLEATAIPSQTSNFSLAADPVACTAPGYQFGSGAVYNEDFEADNGGFTVSGTTSWAWGAPTSGPGAAHSGANVWGTNLAGSYNNFEDGYITSPVIDLSSYAGNPVILDWWQWLQTESGYDYASVEVSNNNGGTWTAVYGPQDGTVDQAWTEHSVLLNPTYAVSTFQFRFHLTSDVSVTYPGWYVDDVSLSSGSCDPQPGGLVVGNVYDANTNAPINGAWVTNTAAQTAYAVATPLDLAVDDGFYTIFSFSGVQEHIATYNLYGDDVQNVDVVSGSTVEQDFNLTSGFLVTNPSGFEVNLELGNAITLPLSLSDVGGAAIDFAIGEVPGTNPYLGNSGVPMLPVVTPSYPENAFTQPKGNVDSALSFSTNPGNVAASSGNSTHPASPTSDYVLTHSVSQNIVSGNSVACNNGFSHTDNSYLRRFTLTDFGINSGLDVHSVDIGIESSLSGSGSQPVEVRLYTWDPATSFTFGNFSLIGQTPYDLADTSTTIINIPVVGTVPAGGTLVVEIFTPDGSASGNLLFVGSNADGQTDSTFLAAADCGVSEPTDTGTLGFPGMHMVMNVYGGAGGDVPWVLESPITGTVPANGSFPVDVTFDAGQVPVPGTYTAQLKIGVDTPQVDVTVPLTLNVTCSTCGTLDGSITDAATNAPLMSTIHITSPGGFDLSIQDVTDYSVGLLPGEYFVNASASGYLSQTTSVNIPANGTVTQDFALWANTSVLSFSPASVEESMNIGDVVTNTVTVTNTGAAPMDYQVHISGFSGPFVLQAQTKIHIPKFTGTIEKIDRPLSAGPAPEMDKAQVQGPILSTPTGEQAYGLDVFPGGNLVQFPDVDVPGTMNVVGSVPQFHPAGDFLNGDFSKLYALDYDTNEFVTIDTATAARTVIATTSPNGSWSGMTGANDGTLYAASSNCGSGSTLYTIDPNSGALTTIGEIGAGTCIIDIAINADGEMYGVDIVSDSLYAIDTATGAGTMVGSLGVDANYAQGMDFEENSGILYWAAYTSQGELRIIDTATGASASVGAIQGGAEIDAFAFPTGGSGSGGWAYAVPDFGTVPPFSTTTFQLVFDARSLYQTGDYFAELSFSGSFANDPGTMPLTMHLACPTCGFLAGNISDAFTTAPVNADVYVSSSSGTAITLTNVVSYDLALQPGSYDFLVTANGYYSQTASVEIAQGQTVVTDFSLIPIVAILEYSPASYEHTVALGQILTDSLTINNIGTSAFDFSLSDVSTGGPTALLAPQAGSILLVDDDDNSPDVRGYYTDALDAMGLSYDVWDTGNSDNEPDAATLAGYKVVIWFTGVEFGGAAGPGGAGESALSTWLDSGACFFISSQDYVYDRGVTPFMTNYLGIASATSDVGHSSVTGQGSLYAGLGPYSLVYPFSNYSDDLNPDGTAELAFSGNAGIGNAAVDKFTNDYATSFLGYPLEAVTDVNDRVAILSAFMDSCASDAPWLIELPATGTVNAGGSSSVDLVFDTSAITQTGTYTAELRFDGTYDNDVTNATVVMHVIDNPTVGVTVGDSMGSGLAGTIVTHTMWITNTGNVSDLFDLSASGYTWSMTVSQDTMFLDPGESAYVICYVSIPADAANGETDTVTVTATSRFDPSASASGSATTEAVVPNHEIYLPLIFK